MCSIPWLDPDSLDFPKLDQALVEPNGLLAAGGDLTPERLIQAYKLGIFPWFNEGEPILWWSPDPRTVLLPEQLHISRSLQKEINQGNYQLSIDQHFSDVLEACAAPRINQDETWLSEEMQEAYIELFDRGVAHSVELSNDQGLIGGLYGIAIGKVFFGESMFSRASNSSKIAFALFVQQLQRWGYELIDCQVSSAHLKSLGAKDISRVEFQKYLDKQIDQSVEHSWQFDSVEHK